ncbi:sensor histidine kinase [Mucilaginibacter sp.]|jgi:signal transduction histidine kinase|uniref:sensor histidine kinase n=1 Tax=Mucilaginibacter sp. TaxID=1882438 RepID=UPI00356B1A11
MINQQQPGGFTGIIRKLFIIFLLFTFVVTAGSFILRHTINTKLERLSSQLRQSSQQAELSRLLVDLNLTENSFQQASSNGHAGDLEAYKQHLKSIFGQMTAISQHYRADSNSYLPESKRQIALGLQQKLAISQQLFDLHKRFDSLLNITTPGSINARLPARELPARGRLRTDTVVSTREEIAKNSLLKRLKDALNKKNAVKVLTIRQHNTGATRADARQNDSKLLKQLGKQYGRLSQSNQELILANLNLLTELRQVIQQLQDIEQLAFEKSREQVLAQYQSTTRDLNTYTGVASALVLVFIISLFVYIRKASGAERRYKVENARAVRLAGQKSEILAIMSHEIRNKLMAINGAVSTLKKTALLPEQEKKIASINLASSLLLETVNNVLDVSKLEQQPAELAVNHFSPLEAMTDSVDAMRFMAENKGVELNLKTNGMVGGALVTGDGFRLKQVLINLLSNAIKYTNKGQVDLTGDLTERDDKLWLSVEVKDTGAGIPKNRQARLFTQYYQAGGQKSGTGLGLYLCRQLILLQGGEINLTSEAGQGCTVCFSIPYDKQGIVEDGHPDPTDE